MSRENNYKIWQWVGTPKGVTERYTNPEDNWAQAPDYCTSDQLLPVLVERGYYPCLFIDIQRLVWRTSIGKAIGRATQGTSFGEGPTIAQAITSAVLPLIGGGCQEDYEDHNIAVDIAEQIRKRGLK